MSGNVSSGFGRMYTLFLVENIGAECQFRVPQEFIINVLVEIIAESVIYFFVYMLGSSGGRGGRSWYRSRARPPRAQAGPPKTNIFEQAIFVGCFSLA